MEREWIAAKPGGNKKLLKSKYKQRNKDLKREIQKAKRRYWYQEQDDLSKLLCKNTGQFWNRIGKLGVRSEKPKDIPMEVKIDDE